MRQSRDRLSRPQSMIYQGKDRMNDVTKSRISAIQQPHGETYHTQSNLDNAIKTGGLLDETGEGLDKTSDSDIDSIRSQEEIIDELMNSDSDISIQDELKIPNDELQDIVSKINLE